MTNTQILQWIRTNNGPAIQQAIKDSSCIYTEDWLAAINMRETGIAILIQVGHGYLPSFINTQMKGDYSKRVGEVAPRFHGFGYWQIDIASFPDFINSGDWSDPYKCCMKAISILEANRKYLLGKASTLTGTELEDYITASYNCGAGNEAKVIALGQDPDTRTFNHDYAKAVRGFREQYKLLMNAP